MLRRGVQGVVGAPRGGCRGPNFAEGCWADRGLQGVLGALGARKCRGPWVLRGRGFGGVPRVPGGVPGFWAHPRGAEGCREPPGPHPQGTWEPGAALSPPDLDSSLSSPPQDGTMQPRRPPPPRPARPPAASWPSSVRWWMCSSTRGCPPSSTPLRCRAGRPGWCWRWHSTWVSVCCRRAAEGGRGPPVMMYLDDFRSPELAEATDFNLRRRKMAARGLWHCRAAV